jgi:hypothetical protein
VLHGWLQYSRRTDCRVRLAARLRLGQLHRSHVRDRVAVAAPSRSERGSPRSSRTDHIRDRWVVFHRARCLRSLRFWLDFGAPRETSAQHPWHRSRCRFGCRHAAVGESKAAGCEGIDSAAMRADSRQTDFCTYLSAILLGGLLLNALLGWWWADPVAGVVMVPIIAKEGVDAVRGKDCEKCGCG